jgi:predicted O-methyltransferase YrrM
MTRILPQPIADYLNQLVPERSEGLVAMEERAARDDFPIVGPAAGQFAYVVARLMGARRIFELGSGFGYSTAWFARAVIANGGGEVHHVVWDEALSAEARDRLGGMGLGEVVRFHVGEAVGILQEAEGPFDLIFNDIDKQGYPDSLPVMAAKLRPGGTILIDNMLWSGRILDPADRSPATEGVREFTRRIGSDPGWEVTLIPIRDGLILARKV